MLTVSLCEIEKGKPFSESFAEDFRNFGILGNSSPDFVRTSVKTIRFEREDDFGGRNKCHQRVRSEKLLLE